ncbi:MULTISPECIES: hypothetical protein [unclassified Achromobacter]|nr:MULTISPECIES: hypothetical protein [unclassified Achromobacter]
MPGWLTPGVCTPGGAQIALKYQGRAIGAPPQACNNGMHARFRA